MVGDRLGLGAACKGPIDVTLHCIVNTCAACDERTALRGRAERISDE